VNFRFCFLPWQFRGRIGWLDAREYAGPISHEERKDLVYIQNILLYEKLIGEKQCGELLAASPSLQELWKTDENPDDPFPP
jgi:hypothetical protein